MYLVPSVLLESLKSQKVYFIFLFYFEKSILGLIFLSPSLPSLFFSLHCEVGMLVKKDKCSLLIGL